MLWCVVDMLRNTRQLRVCVGGEREREGGRGEREREGGREGREREGGEREERGREVRWGYEPCNVCVCV